MIHYRAAAFTFFALLALVVTGCMIGGEPIDSDLSGIYRGSDIPQGANVSNALPAAPSSSLLNRFYQSRSGQLAWQEGGQLLPEAQVLLSEVQKSYQHGLTPNRYLPMALLQQRRLSAPSDAAAQLRLDKHLSYAYLNYIADVRHGRVGSNRSSGVLARAQQGLAAEDFGAWLDAQAPSGATYRNLHDYLARHRDSVDPGAWRLVALNMERLRWHHEINGSRWIRVNLATQQLEAFENGRLVDSMRTVVGRATRRTPIMQDRIWALKFSPDWTVPGTIITQDMIPQSRQDPGYLSRSGYTLTINGRRVSSSNVNWASVNPRSVAVHRPSRGGTGPLGGVRFSLTDGRAIFLHDTNAHHLFQASTRLFSSGCVRVERAEDLAVWIIDADSAITMDRDRVRSAMRGQTHQYQLADPVEVSLMYLTAFVSESGQLQLVTSDPYGHDARLRGRLGL